MADLKISELTSLAGSSLANTDVLAVVDTSASETKKITSKELVQYGYGLVDPSTLDGNVIEPGTTSARGTVQLTDSTGSTSTTTAATPNAVKSAYDLANAALPKAGGTMTGQILGDDSTSASTPGYAFDGDPNTGIYSPGADQLAISTGGTGRVFVSADGNLLVGGTSNAAGSRVLAENASGDQIGIRRTGIATYYLNVTNGGDLAINKDGPERLRITSDGKVGIGTSSPTQTLHVENANLVNASTTFGASAIQTIRGTFGGSGIRELALGVTGDSPNNLYLQARNNSSTAQALLLNPAGGNVGIGTSSPAAALHVNGAELRVETSADSAGFIRFVNTSGSMSVGMSGAPANVLLIYDRTNNHTAYSYEGGASGNHTWSINNQERVRLDSSGRLLVGTSTNTGGALLQVNDDRIRVATAKTPASATDTGSAGEICWDASYVYVCIATNTWKRTAIATW